jgi:lysozyme
MIQSGRYSDAAKGMLSSLWAKQTPARAKRMSEQMRTGVWQFKSGF